MTKHDPDLVAMTRVLNGIAATFKEIGQNVAIIAQVLRPMEQVVPSPPDIQPIGWWDLAHPTLDGMTPNKFAKEFGWEGLRSKIDIPEFLGEVVDGDRSETGRDDLADG